MDMGKVKSARRKVCRALRSVRVVCSLRAGWGGGGRAARRTAVGFAWLVRENHQTRASPAGEQTTARRAVSLSPAFQPWWEPMIWFCFYGQWFLSFFFSFAFLFFLLFCNRDHCTGRHPGAGRHPQCRFLSWNQSQMKMWKYATFRPLSVGTRDFK